MAYRTTIFCVTLAFIFSSCGKNDKENYEDIRDALMEEVEKGCKTIADEFATCVNRLNEGEVTAEERQDRIDECVFNNHSYSKGEIDCLESCEEDLACEKVVDASNCDCENRCGTPCAGK